MPQSLEEKREKKKIAERRRMAKIKADPDLYAQWLVRSRESYQRKKERGKIVPISALTPKQQKLRRQKSRASSNKYNQRKRIATLAQMDEQPIHICNMDTDENIDCDPLQLIQRSPPPLHLDPPPLSSDILLSRPLTRSRGPLSNITNQYKENVFACSSKMNEIRPISPVPSESICMDMASETSSVCPASPQSPRTDISSVTSERQAKISRKKLPPKKSSPWKLLLRRLKYRKNKELQIKNEQIQQLKRQNIKISKQLHRLRKHLTETGKVHKDKTSKKSEITEKQAKVDKIHIIEDIENFFQDDEVSRMTAGKKEFITRHKIKKQKRYLNDSLQNLHTKFLEKYPQYNVSYSYFCKLRQLYAFWAITPNSKIRDTCLCEIHENMDLTVSALNKNSLIKEKSAAEVLSALTCNLTDYNCLIRSCHKCKQKYLEYQVENENNKIEYLKWTRVKKTYMKNGKEMKTTQTSKVTVQAFPKEVIEYFEKSLKLYMQHCAYIIEQRRYIKEIKNNLNNEECLIHCDFSENYNTKYASEIQSFHFGGSRQQISLHTVVVYFKRDGVLQNQCICTLSESLRHDAVAVWEHLLPVLRFIENTIPEVTTLHFLSDSPSGQYRNRKMFFIIAKLNWRFPSLRLAIWNYSEKGHGKGAPDGIGGTLKRTADRIVAQGRDIPNMKTFISHLQRNVSGIILEEVEESAILEKDMLIPTDLKEFRGTMKVHQVVWSANSPDLLAMRGLSCFLGNCREESVECVHGRHIGFFNIETEATQRSTPRNQVNLNKSVSSVVKPFKKRAHDRIIEESCHSQYQSDLDLSDSFWGEVPLETTPNDSIAKTVLSSLCPKDDKHKATADEAAATVWDSEEDDLQIF